MGLWYRFVALAVLLLAASVNQAAFAQTTSEPEAYRNVDEFGVDLSTGTFNFSITEVAGGAASSGINITRTWGRSGWKDAYTGHLKRNGSTITVVRGSVSETFNLSGGNWVAAKANGATLVQTSAVGSGNFFPEYTYTGSDGTVIKYRSVGLSVLTPQDSYPNRYTISGPADICRITTPQNPPLSSQGCAVPILITAPSGRKLSLSWREEGTCSQYGNGGLPLNQGWECDGRTRLEKITDDSGYVFDIRYVNAIYNYNSNWWVRDKVLIIDKGEQYCSPFGYDCATSQNWPTVEYSSPSNGVQHITDQHGRTWTFAFDTSGRMTSITRPGASSPTTTITYGTNGRVSSVTKDGVTKNYTWSTSGGNDVVAVSGGSTGSGTVTTTPSTGQPGTVTNATGNTVSNTYDANKRLKRTTWPEGNYVEYTYDARGNVTQTQFVPKSGSGLANISTSASFDATCTSIAKCNTPNYTIDAKGNRTDYT
ncbi:RHS repeat protein [Tsuneonella flava]|uniref:RHS repeat protein n=1 Tax=Tsuneonella flava TaxID=2055955 RepID=A0ABX7K7U0_9SPHN|nr:RHS repeat domain-containing protein [Tsuneonella flava]QSB44330.1 RHS repeat protein [Tsuneonella flava]